MSAPPANRACLDVSTIEDGTVLRLVMSRPKANILDTEMLTALESALRAHHDDRSLRMVLLRGAGGNFSFGASVEEHRRAQVGPMLARFHSVARLMASYPVPITCAVEGRCLGGAFELVLCAHFVFATVDAVFACPEIKLGVFPPVLAAIGGERMPGAIAERLLLTGEEIDASVAATFGLVTSVVPKGGDVELATLEWYRRTLRPRSALSLRVATSVARTRTLAALERLPAIERRYLNDLVPSHDGNEGIEAFLARREPQWRDA
ncbi:MAG: enoyl-CoA hydratase/isomerase family protein [Polyangiales bacterium]